MEIKLIFVEIAFLGLIENSSVVLVASMLVSPIMGPILAGTFGVIIGDVDLRNRGIQHEVISLVICIMIGFVLGMMSCIIGVETYGISQWPTPEMVNRGQARSLGARIDQCALPDQAHIWCPYGLREAVLQPQEVLHGLQGH